MKGLLVKIEGQSHWVYLQEEKKTIRCVLRGRFKHDQRLKRDKLLNTDIAVAGDFVEVELLEEGAGVITNVYDRANYISRKAPKVKGASYRGERLQQIVAANIDYLFIVCSFGTPPFNNKVLDRFLVISESSQIEPIIVFNKIDLLESLEEIEFWVELYKDLGYEVFPVSAITGDGLDELKKKFNNKKSLFWGHSGVGKSSLINSLFPSLNLAIGEVSTYNQRGKHTTVIVNMNRIDDQTYLIDTPGIRELAPFGIQKDDLGHYFPDIVEFLQDCKYKPCTHHHEPECAVIKAVEMGDISEERYDSYIRLLENVEDDMIF